MSSIITTAKHAIAVAAQNIVRDARLITTKVIPALQQAQAQESTIEAITGLVSPQAVNIERVSFAVLGEVLHALQDAQAVDAAGGLSISLDAALVADLKAIVPAIKAATGPLAATAKA